MLLQSIADMGSRVEALEKERELLQEQVNGILSSLQVSVDLQVYLTVSPL